MATDKLIIEIVGDASQVKPAVEAVKELGKVDKQNAEQFQKTNNQYRIAAANRKDLIKQEQKDLGELEERKKKAFSVKEINQYNDRIKETKNRISTLKNETGGFASFAKNQFLQLGTAIAGAFAVQRLVTFGVEAVKVAAAAEGVKAAFDRLNRPDLLNNLRTATKGTVSDLDLMKNAVKANNFQIPLEKLATLLKFAQIRAQETGESVDYLVESIVLGISRKSIPILDNLGISAVQIQEEMKKTGDFADAAFNIVNQSLATMDSSLDTTAVKLARMTASWDNFVVTAGNSLIKFVDIANRLDSPGKFFGEIFREKLTGTSTELENFIHTINETVGEFEDARANSVSKEVARLREQNKEYKATEVNVAFLRNRMKELTAELDDETRSAKQNIITVENMALVQAQLDKILGKTTEKIKEQTKALDNTFIETVAEGARQAAQRRIDEEEKAEKEIAALKQAGADEAARIKKAELDERLRLDDILEENAKKNEEEITENLRREAEERAEIIAEVYNGITTLASTTFDLISQYERTQTQNFLDNLELQRNAGKISDEQYTQQRKAFLTKQAEDERELAIFQATVKAALAVINAITTGDPYTAAARAAVAAAIGAAEVAIVASAPLPQFEKGGYHKGKRHKQGGIEVEVEDGEYTLNRKAVDKIGLDNIELLNKGIVPVKMLRQTLSEQREKSFANNMMKALGSNNFDTYPIEKLLKRGIKKDEEIAQYIVSQLRTPTQKRSVK